MASGPHTFMTCSVFSPERFKGNPLAIVAVRGNALSQQRKSLIAKEFGYSETVFVHDAPGPGLPRRIDIFTEQGEEIPFAGHPVIGVAHYIFSYCRQDVPSETHEQASSATVMTKAGPIPIMFNSYRQVAACAVPHDVHVHSAKVDMENILMVQPQVRIIPTFEKIQRKSFPVVSIVKGMTFALIDLSDAPETLAGLKASNSPEVELDSEWQPSFVGALYYTRRQQLDQSAEPIIHAIRARMITQNIEDPGTGSACCALACYLALHETGTGTDEAKEPAPDAETDLVEGTSKVTLEDKDDGQTERQVFAIQQGVEMGRECTIAVEVQVKKLRNGSTKIVGVTLSGRANFFLQGQLLRW